MSAPEEFVGVRWALLHAEAKARGFRNALAFRRWCRRLGVPVRATGKLRWVERAAVDRAIERGDASGAPPARPTSDDAPAVAAAVAQLQRRPAGQGRARR